MARANSKSPVESSLENLLPEWSGEEEGKAELLRFRPEAKVLSDLLERAVSKCIKPWTMRLARLQQSWGEIAGPEIAGKCTVLSVENSIVYIEVRHPAFLRVLDSPPVKNSLLEKIHTVLSEEEASQIKFLAAGSFR